MIEDHEGRIELYQNFANEIEQALNAHRPPPTYDAVNELDAMPRAQNRDEELARLRVVLQALEDGVNLPQDVLDYFEDDLECITALGSIHRAVYSFIKKYKRIHSPCSTPRHIRLYTSPPFPHYDRHSLCRSDRRLQFGTSFQ